MAYSQGKQQVQFCNNEAFLPPPPPYNSEPIPQMQRRDGPHNHNNIEYYNGANHGENYIIVLKCIAIFDMTLAILFSLWSWISGALFLKPCIHYLSTGRFWDPMALMFRVASVGGVAALVINGIIVSWKLIKSCDRNEVKADRRRFAKQWIHFTIFILVLHGLYFYYLAAMVMDMVHKAPGVEFHNLRVFGVVLVSCVVRFIFLWIVGWYIKHL